MSWKAGLSRYLPCMRFFACPTSPSSKGVMTYYCNNYDELKLLNPNFPLMMRTVENAMPAVTTELDWTTQDLLRFMIQTGRFRDADGAISQSRVEAAQAYLAADWDKLLKERFKSPGIDPERPGLDEVDPGWRDRESVKSDLATYFTMKGDLNQQMQEIRSGPSDEYTRAENALLMCQRVDLWCAGEAEVERAVQHLYRLGKMLNNREVELPTYVAEYAPGRGDIDG